MRARPVDYKAKLAQEVPPFPHPTSWIPFVKNVQARVGGDGVGSRKEKWGDVNIEGGIGRPWSSKFDKSNVNIGILSGWIKEELVGRLSRRIRLRWEAQI